MLTFVMEGVRDAVWFLSAVAAGIVAVVLGCFVASFFV